jgi:hypothetical protein
MLLMRMARHTWMGQIQLRLSRASVEGGTSGAVLVRRPDLNSMLVSRAVGGELRIPAVPRLRPAQACSS